jgi:hypothetical protein
MFRAIQLTFSAQILLDAIDDKGLRHNRETVAWLRYLRLLSRILNNILLPIVFHRVDLTKSKALCDLTGHDPSDKHWHEFEVRTAFVITYFVTNESTRHISFITQNCLDYPVLLWNRSTLTRLELSIS